MTQELEGSSKREQEAEVSGIKSLSLCLKSSGNVLHHLKQK